MKNFIMAKGKSHLISLVILLTVLIVIAVLPFPSEITHIDIVGATDVEKGVFEFFEIDQLDNYNYYRGDITHEYQSHPLLKETDFPLDTIVQYRIDPPEKDATTTIHSIQWKSDIFTVFELTAEEILDNFAPNEMIRHMQIEQGLLYIVAQKDNPFLMSNEEMTLEITKGLREGQTKIIWLKKAIAAVGAVFLFILFILIERAVKDSYYVSSTTATKENISE